MTELVEEQLEVRCPRQGHFLPPRRAVERAMAVREDVDEAGVSGRRVARTLRRQPGRQHELVERALAREAAAGIGREGLQPWGDVEVEVELAEGGAAVEVCRRARHALDVGDGVRLRAGRAENDQYALLARRRGAGA